jgi:hypothetical protein
VVEPSAAAAGQQQQQQQQVQQQKQSSLWPSQLISLWPRSDAATDTKRVQEVRSSLGACLIRCGEFWVEALTLKKTHPHEKVVANQPAAAGKTSLIA